MHKILGNWMYILGFIGVVIFFSGWFDNSSDEVIELPASLANVQCLPKPDSDKHAKSNRMLLEYDTYAIYHLCIPSFMMAKKDELKCNYTDHQSALVCDNQVVLKQNFVHAGVNDIYAIDKPNTRTANAKSKIAINFSQSSLSITEPEFKYYTSDEYIRKGINVPSNLRLRNEPVCESALDGKRQGESQVIRDTSSCFVDASFGVLNIKMEIESLADSNNKIKRREQIEEINFWLHFVSQLVITNNT